MADTAGDPDALQREIERTRDELTRTIDALTERMHPKRMARDGVERAKAGAVQARNQAKQQVGGKLPGGMGAGGGRHGGPPAHPPGGSSGGIEDVRTTTYLARGALRPEGIAIAVGACLLVVAGLIVWRRRRG